jgi:hypothetical protein
VVAGVILLSLAFFCLLWLVVKPLTVSEKKILDREYYRNSENNGQKGGHNITELAHLAKPPYIYLSAIIYC